MVNRESTAHAAEALVKKFDFGPASSPVMAGYNQVNNQLSYTQERGYAAVLVSQARRIQGGFGELFV
jgi:fibronectin type 3 domain-containing protein